MMTMMRSLKKAFALAAVTAGVIASLAPVSAKTSAEFAAAHQIGGVSAAGFTYVSTGSSEAVCYSKAKAVLQSEYPVIMGANPWLPLSYAYVNGQVGGFAVNASIDIINENEMYMENWLAKNLTSAVPAGTAAKDVPMVVAKYVASVARPYTAYVDNGDVSYTYQFAYPKKLFSEGIGICSTYTSAFNVLVHSTPIDPATGTVDYRCGNAVYLEVEAAATPDHAWSAVKLDGAWHFYDVCYYDGTGSSSYLDMTAAAMSDADHIGWSFT